MALKLIAPFWCLVATVLSCTFSLCVRAQSTTRNPKKGLAIKESQSCNATVEHTKSTWWYSWSFDDGFQNSFCTDPVTAVANARASGMEFVPMFWSSVPPRPFTATVEANFQAASYIIGLNEPERADQANKSGMQAAVMWADIESIASDYGLEIVAPCVTQDLGVTWYADWQLQCNSLYQRDCHFDYTCVHLYYNPYPCVDNSHYACIQQGAARAINKINQWYNLYNKPIWVTEYACAPWGLGGCDVQKEVDLMNQLTPVLESSEKIFRYAWFVAYTSGSNALNQILWDTYNGVGCANRRWLLGWGGNKSIQRCVTAAKKSTWANATGTPCFEPLSLSMDDDGCYCATDNCATLVSTWGAMRTYKKNGIDEYSSALTPLGELYNDEPWVPAPNTPQPVTPLPTTAQPTTAMPTTAPPTPLPTTAQPTTAMPTTAPPTPLPTTSQPTTAMPTTPPPISSPSPTSACSGLGKGPCNRASGCAWDNVAKICKAV